MKNQGGCQSILVEIRKSFTARGEGLGKVLEISRLIFEEKADYLSCCAVAESLPLGIVSEDAFMERRAGVRWDTAESKGAPEAACLFDVVPPAEGVVKNISLGGFCVAIRGISRLQSAALNRGRQCFVTLRIGNESIVASARVVWVDERTVGGVAEYVGGLSFEVMSPEERLKLASLIARMRGSGAQ